MLNTDLPYLEPLLFHLRQDPVLKKSFTEKSFFMPHSDLISATEEAMKKDCPAPRALWILPQDTLATITTQKNSCNVPGNHTFFIEIIVQCIRNQFTLVKRGDEVKLEGQFMELAQIRKQVKNSVSQFGKDNSKLMTGQTFSDLVWIKDSMLYPTEDTSFLATAIEYRVKIF